LEVEECRPVGKRYIDHFTAPMGGLLNPRRKGAISGAVIKLTAPESKAVPDNCTPSHSEKLPTRSGGRRFAARLRIAFHRERCTAPQDVNGVGTDSISLKRGGREMGN